MADEPNWQPAEAPPWAKQAEPNWQPAEAPPWAPKAEQGVLERAGTAAAETFKSGLESGKKLLTPRSKEEAEEGYGVVGALKGLKETAEGLISPLTMTVGAGMAVPQSLIASGMAAALPGGGKTSQQKYEDLYPQVGTALTALGPGRGRGAVGPTSGLKYKTPTTPEAEAGRFIESKASDPEALRQQLEQPAPELAGPGDKPTTFQLTGDQGIGAQERLTARKPDQVERFLERKEEQTAARQKALEELQPTGSPAAVSEHLRDIMRTENEAGDAAVAQAQQRLQQSVDQMGGNLDATTYGNIFRRELEMAEERVRGGESQLWRAVDPDGTLLANPRSVQDAERGIYGRLTTTAAASVTPAEVQLTNLIQEYRPAISFQELRDLRSLTSTALREELYTRGRTPAYARLSQLRQGIEDAVEQSVFDAAGGPAGDAAERLRAASAATRERAAQFRPTRAITRREGVEGPYKLEEVSTIPGKIIAPGAKGYDTASNYLRAVGNERGLPELQDAIAATMRREITTPDGSINPNKLQGWLKRYQDVLRAVDERDGGAFSQRLRNVGTAQEAVETAEANRASLGKLQAGDQFKRLTGAVDDADISRMVGNIFGKQDSVARARDLMTMLRGNDAAVQGARNALVAHIRDQLTSNALIGQSLGQRSEQFQKWVLNQTNNAALRQILDPAQVKSLENIAMSLRQAARSNQTKAIGGGSDTYQNMVAGEAQQGIFKQLAKKAASSTASRVGAHILASWLGGPAGSAALAGIEGTVGGVRAAGAARKAKRIESIQEMVDDAILNPERAKELLSKTTPQVGRKGRGAFAYEAGALANEQRNRDQRVPRQAGGGVPAIGGTGGRSPGATTAIEARKARQGAGQALQDGGTAGDGQASPVRPGSREIGELLKGMFGSGSGLGSLNISKNKAPPPLRREDVIKQLKGRGITGEAAAGFGQSMPSVDSRD